MSLPKPPRRAHLGDSTRLGRSAPDLAHAPGRPHEVDLADRMASPLGRYFGGDRFGQVVVGPAAPQDRSQVTLADSEQAAA